jgi:hypothetical protein
MIDIWTMGPTAAGVALRSRGFSPPEADRLVRLRLTYQRGEFRELTDEQKRLTFARWLVEHGHLGEEPSGGTANDAEMRDDNRPL